MLPHVLRTWGEGGRGRTDGSASNPGPQSEGPGESVVRVEIGGGDRGHPPSFDTKQADHCLPLTSTILFTSMFVGLHFPDATASSCVFFLRIESR
jgi:hypothetical protein